MPIFDERRRDVRRSSRSADRADRKQYDETLTDFVSSERGVSGATTVKDKLAAYEQGMEGSMRGFQDLVRHYLAAADERRLQYLELSGRRDELDAIATGDVTVPYVIPLHTEWARTAIEAIEGYDPNAYAEFSTKLQGLFEQAIEAHREFLGSCEEQQPVLSKIKLRADDKDGLARATRDLDKRFDRTLGTIKKLMNRSKDEFVAVHGKSYDHDLAHTLAVYVLDEESRREDYERDRAAEDGYEAKIDDMRERVDREHLDFLTAWSSAKDRIDEHVTRATAVVESEDLVAVAAGTAPATAPFHSTRARALIVDGAELSARISSVQETVSTDMLTEVLDAYGEILHRLAHQAALLEDAKMTLGPRERHIDGTPRKDCLLALTKIRTARWRASFHARVGASPLDERRIGGLESAHASLTDVDTRLEETRSEGALDE